jgi:hypothetical protein
MQNKNCLFAVSAIVSIAWSSLREVLYYHTKFGRNRCNGVELHKEKRNIHTCLFHTSTVMMEMEDVYEAVDFNSMIDPPSY